jgi:cupin domain
MEPRRFIVVRPGEGRRVGNVEFLARSEDTPRFNLAVITINPHREGPETHAHADEDDSFYILDGELTFVVEGDEVVAGPGTFVLVPRAFRTRSRTAATPWRRSSTFTRQLDSTSVSKTISASILAISELARALFPYNWFTEDEYRRRRPRPSYPFKAGGRSGRLDTFAPSNN